MANTDDKQIAKEILIAYIAQGHTGGLFTQTNPAQPTIEEVWNRIVKAVSGDSEK